MRSVVRAVVGGGAAVTVAAGLVVASAPAHAAGEQYLKTLGGPGHAMLYPSGLEVDPSTGDLVVADTGNDKVSRYTADGTLVWELPKLEGDDGPLENVRDIAISDNGTIYVADAGRARVVKLNKDGKQQGVPWQGPNGDRIKSPIGITEKNGKIYVADGGAARGPEIWVFEPTSNGNPAYRIPSPVDTECALAALRDVDADDAGNLYIANYTKNNIVKLAPNGDCLDAWGFKGDGLPSSPGEDPQFRNPYGVRVAEDPVWGETLYVADSNNNRIQIFTLDGELLEVVGATGAPTEPGTFTTLRRVAVTPDGDVWGADLWGSRAVRFERTASGFSYDQTLGDGLGPLEDDAVFNEVRGIDQGPDGVLNVVDTVNQRVVRMTRAGEVLGSCGGRTNSGGSVNWPRDVAVDPATGNLWLADTKQNRIQVWDTDCNLIPPRLGDNSGKAGNSLGEFHWPHAITIRDEDGIAFIADTENNRVVAYNVRYRNPLHEFSAWGDPTQTCDRGAESLSRLCGPRGITIAPDGMILVADTEHDRLVRLNYDKSTGFTYGGKAENLGLSSPEGIATTPGGSIWVADTGNGQVVEFSAAANRIRAISSIGGARLNSPSSVAVDSAGRVYISDTHNDRIVVLDQLVVPTAPASVVATAGNRAVAVTWSAGQGNGFKMLGYTVIVYGPFGQEVTRLSVPPESRSATIDGLTNGQTYTVKVRAVSEAGSALSAASNEVTPSKAAAVERWSGASRYETAVRVSQESYPDGDVPLVVIASGVDFPDALAAVPLAARNAGPVLLVAPNSLPPVVLAELQRLSPERIVVAGGPAAVSDAVKNRLESVAPVERVSGSSRYETAAALAEAAYPEGAQTVYLATGAGFADALAAGPVAFDQEAPILLTPSQRLHPAAAAALDALGAQRVVAVGGTSALANSVLTELRSLGLSVSRVGGESRYETAARLVAGSWNPGDSDTVFVATGQDFPDALAGAAAAARLGAPLVLSAGRCMPDVSIQEIARLQVDRIVGLGGPVALSDAALNRTRCG